ncbi:stalk domain-containing protein [Ammoniphilus resinae]|uniref:ABC-type antimicrobial peptide transport system permease subunit n=1 Tax=Ammoniphilus resinae TaxID=861532 RepID=A0ABS4GQP4_9BACL|nr:stalk domain-containing protein [Ammoniphilus resinae]MBP1932551.1 ABC-type antimicrobial peptide transport system permease subunit [Ammoniphilus resinae]
MKQWKKTAAVLGTTTVLVSGTLFSTGTYASQAKKMIEATYQDIKIVYNGNEVAVDAQTEPFTIKGTTFIPLRQMGELYNKNVQWDAINHKILITDKAPVVVPDSSQVIALKVEIANKDARIKQLEQQLADAKESSKKGDIDDLEDQLNDDYEDFYDGDLDASIELSGDEDEIEVFIEVDEDEWNDLSTRERENLIENMVDDILEEFEDAEITGAVEDGSSTLLTFTADTDGDVEYADLDDLEDELNDDYEDYFRGIRLSIDLSGDTEDITFRVNIALDDYQDEWDDLDQNDIDDLFDDIVDDIEKKFKSADIEGDIYDTDNRKVLDRY